MKLSLTQKHLLAGVIALAITVLFALSYMSSQKANASAPSGLPATVATSSPIAVTNTQLLVFATSTCAARIIGTGVNGIMITFTDAQGFVPTATQGFWQAASTTVAYDSGQYGCGAVRIYSSVAQTLWVSESR